MTANNPPIAAWAPSTALAKLASRHNNAPCVLTDGPAEFNDVALIRLADYQRLQADHERLQAEREKLRKDAERIEWLADPNNSIGNVQLPMVIVRQHLHSLRDAIDAAMEPPK